MFAAKYSFTNLYFMRKLFKSGLMLWMLFCWAFSTWAQERSISGKVTNTTDGSPLPGVNVIVKGTTIGSITDTEGNYSLNVPASAKKLIFSFVGFITKEMEVPSASSLNVSLQEDVTGLEEVIVTGLATSIKRSNLANAVVTISAAELVGTTKPVTLDAAMNGKIVGATISANSGAPGGGFSVRLRGVSSISLSSEPLYIIDGVYVSNDQFATGSGTGAFSGATAQTAGTQDQATNRIADINPADVENIEILKGPSAAAIYGTRANAGVIIITTKKGKAGKTSIQFGQDIGYAEALRFVNMHKTIWDKQFQYGVALADGPTLQSLYAQNGSGSSLHDYERMVYGRKGVLKTTRLSLSGGTEKLKFYAAASSTNEEGIQKKTGFSRNSIRLNLDFQVNKWIDLTIGSNYLNSYSSRSFSGNDNNGVSLGYNLAYLPNWLNQLPDANGIYPENRITGQNPLQIVDKAENREETNRFIQSFALNFKILTQERHSLKLALQGGVDYLLTESRVYMPDDIQFQTRRANPGASRYTKSRNFNNNLQAFLVDQLQVSKFGFTTSLGTVRLGTNQDISWIQGEGLPAGQRNPNVATVRTISEQFANWNDVGLVAQEEINWDDKVIVTGGIRFDKSTLNGDPKKYYAFPKASVAVNVANFDFWKISQVNLLKIRAAYGQTGNPAGFGSTFTPLVTSIIDSKLGLSAPTVQGNPIIKPEIATETEVGIDLGLFSNRVSLEASYYNKTIKDFINTFALSPGTGVTSISAFNVGDLENKGLELSLGITPVQKAKITWNTRLNYFFNRAKVTRLDVPEFVVGSSGFGVFGTNRIRLGQSPFTWYGSPLDANGQRTAYEQSQPKFQMQWSNSITFLKNFEFSFLLHWSYKNYNSSLNQELTDEGGTSPDWGKPNTNDKLSGDVVGVARQLGNGATTRQYIVDASYIKLREIALYYSLPKNILPKLVQGVKVGFSGNNVGLWTSYYGYDPEASNFGNRPVGTGVDLLSFPSSRRLFFHLNVTL
jgi:TonB-linked SusC/RagA family outer membrane protein